MIRICVLLVELLLRGEGHSLLRRARTVVLDLLRV
jgi:hypothetical protein